MKSFCTKGFIAARLFKLRIRYTGTSAAIKICRYTGGFYFLYPYQRPASCRRIYTWSAAHASSRRRRIEHYVNANTGRYIILHYTL